MAKIQIIDSKGSKIKEVETGIFDNPIREDIVQKIVETEKHKQPYAPYLWAGMETSASGNVKHLRHSWKSDRGKGMSRFPKKRMSDKGDRFVWIAAVIPGVRKGRRAHPPKTIRRELTINKKEFIIGMKSALAMISSAERIKDKYSKLNQVKIKLNLPLVVESKILTLKAKDFFAALKNILGQELFNVAIQEKTVRCGIGKMRGRKYKKNAGMLLIIGNKENKKISGIDIVKANDLKLINIAANGARLTMLTEEAVKDLENKFNLKKNDKRI